MIKSRFNPRFQPKEKKFIRINEMIRISPIRVIDEDGSQLGIIETFKAMQLAKERGVDLVEVNPHSQPPVCKIIDWGKYQYLQTKKEKEGKKKQKRVDIKGIRIRPSTGENDLNFKIEQIKKFLKDSHKVKIEILLKGRENAHRDQAKNNLKKFIDKINFPFKIEQDIQKHFTGFNVIISPDK